MDEWDEDLKEQAAPIAHWVRAARARLVVKDEDQSYMLKCNWRFLSCSVDESFDWASEYLDRFADWHSPNLMSNSCTIEQRKTRENLVKRTEGVNTGPSKELMGILKTQNVILKTLAQQSTSGSLLTSTMGST